MMMVKQISGYGSVWGELIWLGVKKKSPITIETVVFGVILPNQGVWGTRWYPLFLTHRPLLHEPKRRANRRPTVVWQLWRPSRDLTPSWPSCQQDRRGLSWCFWTTTTTTTTTTSSTSTSTWTSTTATTTETTNYQKNKRYKGLLFLVLFGRWHIEIKVSNKFLLTDVWIYHWFLCCPSGTLSNTIRWVWMWQWSLKDKAHTVLLFVLPLFQSFLRHPDAGHAILDWILAFWMIGLGPARGLEILMVLGNERISRLLNKEPVGSYCEIHPIHL